MSTDEKLTLTGRDGRGLHPNSQANLSRKYPNYGEWLANLTPEQREAHNLAKLTRKTMKQAVQQQIDSVQAEWAHALSQAAERVLQRAIENGDPQALATVWDRLVGKPKDTVEHTLAQEDTVEDIVSKLQAQSVSMAAMKDLNINNNTGDLDEKN